MTSVVVVLAVFLAQAGQNLLVNGRFQQALDGWKANGRDCAVEQLPDKGTAGRVTVAPEEPVGYPGLSQSFQTRPGDVLSGSVTARADGIRDGFGAYVAINFYRANGERISWRQSGPVAGGDAWQLLSVFGVTPPETVRADFCLILNGHGTAYFTDAMLRVVDREEEEPDGGPVTLTVTDDVVCERLLGFGFEDDGWFYNDENASHGLTEQDYALREARIEWMKPDFVRMFFWYKDWNPSGDGQTFTFDTPNMKSKYRTLDLYQRLGASIDVTGVEWGMREIFAEPQRVVGAVGALMEHLVRVKGYTCVRYWTLTNEPDLGFLRDANKFECYVQLHQLVREEFRKRNLPIQIVGSDEATGLSWFARCVEDTTYYDSVDLFASHRYMQKEDRSLARLFFDERMERLRSKTPAKPFVTAEFGFQDARSSNLLNPVMEEYPYAVWSARFAIEGLNKGVAGFSIWCLHEVYYPGQGFMNYGLWDYKDNDWRVRPVYHDWAMFTRMTNAGDRVRRVESSHRRSLQGACVGNTLFWANDSETVRTVRIEGFDCGRVTVMTKDNLAGDRECGLVETVKDRTFEAPAMSFGYLQ